jgi:spore maturation protein A
MVGSIIITLKTPENLINVYLAGGEKGITLSVTLLAIYAIWLGIFELLEVSGLSGKLAKLLKKPIRFLFGKVDDEEERLLSTNISANLLGLNGISTPVGVSACESFDKKNNFYAQSMLYVLCATSLQILPTSVISLRAEYLSVNPSDIFLPTLIATSVSTIVGIILVKLLVKK